MLARSLAVLVCAGLFGCTSAKYRVIEKPDAAVLRGFQSVLVRPVDTDSWLEANEIVKSDKKYKSWRDELKVAQIEISNEVRELLAAKYLIVNQPGKHTLIIRSELILFEPDRDMSATGTAKTGVRVALEHAESGRNIGSAEVFGAVSVGSFRQSFVQCGRGIAAFVGDHMKKRSEAKQ